MSPRSPQPTGWRRWWRLARRMRTSYSFLRINLFLSLPELRGRGRGGRLAARVLLFRLLNDLDFDLLPWRRHRVEGLEHLRSALADGRGCIACTFHVGAYRRLAVELVLLGYAVDLVVDRRTAASLKSRLAAGVRRYRDDARAVEERLRVLDAERHGMVAEILVGLRENRVVLVYLDGNTGVEGPGAKEGTRGNQILVDFFARRLAVRRGIAQIAFVTGAPLLPLFAAWRGAFRPCLRFHPAIRPPAGGGAAREAFPQHALQELFALAEGEVRARPGQFEHWLYLHRWEAPPQQITGRRSAAAAASLEIIEEARASGRLLRREPGQSLQVRIGDRHLLSCAATGALLPLDADGSRLLRLLVRPRAVDEMLRHFAAQRQDAAIARLSGFHAHSVITPADRHRRRLES